jgi:hypothetical protein
MRDPDPAFKMHADPGPDFQMNADSDQGKTLKTFCRRESIVLKHKCNESGLLNIISFVFTSSTSFVWTVF